MGNLRPISQKQFMVNITGGASELNLLFTKVTAPKESRETYDYNDGNRGTTYKAVGFTQRDNVTLTKPFNPEEDKRLVNWYKEQQKADAQAFSVAIKPVNADASGTLFANSGTLVLLQCEVVALKMPDVDRMGNGVAMIELEVIYKDWSYS